MLWWWFATKVRDAAWNEITTCEITAYNVLPYEILFIQYNILFYNGISLWAFVWRRFPKVVLK